MINGVPVLFCSYTRGCEGELYERSDGIIACTVCDYEDFSGYKG